MSKRGVMLRDPISDLFTRIRNGYRARRATITHPHSRNCVGVVDTLVRHGYLSGVQVVPPPSLRAAQYDTMHIHLKYDSYGNPALRRIRRVSKPSRRQYRRIDDIPLASNGLGGWILSTNKGVLHCTEAREHRIGGEVLGEIL